MFSTLRFGLASDPVPKEMLHCIARKRKTETSSTHSDPFLVKKVKFSFSICDPHKNHTLHLYPQAKLDPESFQSVESARFQVSQALKTSPRSDGGKRLTVSGQHLADRNSRVGAVRVESNDLNTEHW